ncbi:MAG: hypothetical protein KUG77_04300 [Nannocystaceae bacterium]|nr:hypothetical protein [Nannocystaceae bacterium]
MGTWDSDLVRASSAPSALVLATTFALAACSSGDNATQGGAVTLGSPESSSTGDLSPSDTSNNSGSKTTGGSGTSASGVDTNDEDTGPESTTGTSITGTDEGTTGNVPPASCAEDVAACDAWVLAPGAGAWEPIAIGGPAPLAPTGEVVAAFDVEAPQLAYVLSATDVSVLDMTTRSWVSKLDFAATFPNVGDDPLLTAYSIPGHWTASFGGDANLEGLTLLSATTVYLYEHNIEAETFTFQEAVSFRQSWHEANAPTKSQLRAGWLDVTNAHDWVTGSPAILCDADATETGPYTSVIASTQVHISESGICFDFFPPVTYAAFPPTSLPGAPAVGIVGAAAYSETEGLWLFRGT